MPEITVVMPTYNQGKFIQEAVDSILNQTFKNFELIVVNDSSSDNTEEIVKGYFRHAVMKNNIGDYGVFPEGYYLRYLFKPNGGTGSSLNEGFKHSRGKYETWFSSDNILYSEALQTMYDYLETHPDIDYVYCNCEIGIMDQATGLIELDRKNLEREVSQEWKTENLIHHYFLGIVWLWRRQLREKVGEFQLEPCEDYDFVLRAYDAGFRFAYVPQCLGWFRRHFDNMSWKIASSGDRDRYSRLAQEKSRKRTEALKR